MKKLSGVSILVLTLLYVACVGWLYTHHLLCYRRIALEVPIRFEKGFSFERQFTVDTPVTYWVAIKYDDIFRSTPEVQLPHDEFTAEFEVTSPNKVITRGSSAIYPDWTGPWTVNRDYVIRNLGSFDAEPGKVYQLSLRLRVRNLGLFSKTPKQGLRSTGALMSSMSSENLF